MIDLNDKLRAALAVAKNMTGKVGSDSPEYYAALKVVFAAVESQVATPAPQAAPSGPHADCCDTPHLCSAVRRCTAQDGAAPLTQAADQSAEAPGVLQQIIAKADHGVCHGLLADTVCSEIAKLARDTD